VVAIVGQSATTALGSSYQQEVDLQVLMQDVCEYAYTVASSAALRHVVDRAVRTAIGMRAVTCVIVPKDVQEENAVPEPPHEHNTAHSSVGYSAPVVLPAADDLKRAAEILNQGERVAMLIGAGTLGQSETVIAVANRLGAGVAKALLGKAALADDLPFVTGTIGLLGTRPSYDMMRRCDTLLMVGTSFPYGEFLPKEGHARGIQIDIDPRNLGLRYPTELNLVGDAGETLRALLPLLEQKDAGDWRERLRAEIESWRDEELQRSRVEADGINPQRAFVEMDARLPSNAIVTGDAGTPANWLARNVRVRDGMKISLSGGLATMGSAVPYAIAAKFAFPERVAIACAGDGAMQMNGLAELLTVQRYWRGWSDPRLIFFVLNNSDLNQVTWEMRVESGNPKFDASQDLPRFDYARFADSIGLLGIRVERTEDVGAAWDRAFGADRPVVLDVVVDPNVVQLPPHVTFEQARNFWSALRKGDPQEGAVIADSIKSMLAGIFAKKGDE
jgi:pyruvate dehydrogenase (quinone)